MPWQHLNHYPKSTAITKKDALARNLKRMKGVHGPTVYNFSPTAFNLPNDYTKFVAEYTKMREKDPDKMFWICKPADLSRGRGIFVFKDLGELQYDCNAVVQQYITNPLLISGYKFDLRIYVLVPSFHPLNIYIYQEGLVRFSTEKYDLNSLKNMYSHLTNTSINKNSPAYSVDKERIGPGCKWTLTQLRHYFHSVGIDDAPMFAKVINIIILTLLIQVQQVPMVSNCFELYGFDIIFDENLKPWLLEVNFSPALSTDCATDFLVKKPLLHDLIELLHYTEEDKQRGGEEYKEMRSQASSLYPNFGGRRSNVGNNNNNRRLSQLQKRGSSNHLPSIQTQNGNNLTKASPRSVLSGEYGISNSEQEEIASEPRISINPNQSVPALVPGCGLPSVQLPKSRGRPMGLDSDYATSTEFSDVNDNDKEYVNGPEKSAENSQFVIREDRVADMQVSRKVQGSEQTSRDSTSENTNRVTKSSETYSHTYKARGLKQPPNLKAPKSSVNSDSGISSYSGSGNSDNRYLQSQQCLDEGNLINSLSYTHKSENSKRLSHISYRDNAVKEADQSNGGTVDTETIESSKQSDKFDAAFNTKLDTVRKGMAHQGYASPTGPKYRTNRKGERLSRISRDFRSPRKTYMANNTSSQTRVISKPPAPRSLSQMSNYSPGQIASKSSFRDKRSNYAKPWRRTTKPDKEAEKPATPKPTPQCPQKIVGDFHLVYPFNETCKRTSDPKVIIKECQKFIRQRIANFKASEQSKVNRQTSRTGTPMETVSSAKSSRQGSDFTASTSSVSNFGVGNKESYPNSGRNSKMTSQRPARSGLMSSRSSSKTLLHASSSSLNTVSSTDQSLKFVQPNRNVFAKEPADLWSPVKALPKDSG